MNLEEAYSCKLLLQAGINKWYESWLDAYLEKENPLSDIILELNLSVSSASDFGFRFICSSKVRASSYLILYRCIIISVSITELYPFFSRHFILRLERCR